MQQITDSLLARYRKRKLKYGGDDWTGTDTNLSPEDQALTGIDAVDYNPTGKRTMVEYKNSFDGSEGFGDALSVDGSEGSGLTSAQGSNLMSGIVTVGSGAVMAANKKNNNPNSNYTNAGYYKTQGAAKGATTGASLGASFGPIGIAAGAVVGGVAGYFTGKKKDKQAAQEFARDNSEFEKMRRLEMEGRQPDEPRTNNQFYKHGGSLLDKFKRTSSSTVEVEGPSHEAGGVPVPGTGAEVEGGETIAGDYVFSKELGFADLHKPIARMKGKVEKKPATRERMNTLKLLNQKENQLRMAQEYAKHKLNLQ